MIHARHICVIVAVAVVAARPWVVWLQPPGYSPVSYVGALLVGVGFVLAHACAANHAARNRAS